MGLSRRTAINPLDVLAAIKTVDGQGSGLDADLIDNLHAADLIDEALQQAEIGLANSPALGGIPTAPTAAAGTATQQIATTQFVAAAISGSVAGVSSFNGRAGAVMPQSGDYSAADVGALPNTTVIPTALAQLSADSTHRLVSDADKTDWSSRAITITKQATIPLNWTESNGLYIQTVSVTGLNATDNPIVDIVLGADAAANEAALTAWQLVQRITTAANSITLYATAAPQSAFAVQLKVVR